MTVDWPALLQQYGLPLTILVAFAFLILSGRLVTGAQLAQMTTLFERERTDRIAAEAIVARFALGNASLARSVEGLAAAVLEDKKPKSASDLYGDRLEGTR